MIPQKSNTCQQDHTHTNNPSKKKSQSLKSKKEESLKLNNDDLKKSLSKWSHSDRRLLEWFFDYLERYLGTRKNPIYSILKEKIAGGPQGIYSLDGSLQLELTRIKTLIERNGY